MQEIGRPPSQIRRMRETQLWSLLNKQEGEIEKSKRGNIFEAVVRFLDEHHLGQKVIT